MSVANVQVQPVPLIAVGTGGFGMLGKVSTTVTVPEVGPKPTLLTVIVHCAPVWPRLKVPECVLVMVGSGARTSIDAVAWLPEPAFVEVIVPVVFTLWPLVVPVTFTEKVQEPPAAMVPPERLTDEAEVVIVPEPQDPVRPFGLATTRPAGRASVNATPARATVEFGLVMVKLKVVL